MRADYAPIPDIGFAPTMPEWMRRAVARYGDQELMVTASQRLSFREVDAQSRVLARELLGAGVGKGTRVAIHATYGHEWLISWIAVTRIGALALPLASSYTPGEVRRALRFADADLLITPRTMFGRDQLAFVEEALEGLTSAHEPLRLPTVPFLRRVWVLGPSDRAWAHAVTLGASASADAVDDALLDEVESEVSPADPMVVISTSGSTADPKGVVHTHGTVIRKTAVGQLITGIPPGPNQRVFAGYPFYWVGGIQTIGGALHTGATLVCQERFEPAEALDLIEHERVTSVNVWPTLRSRLEGHPSFPGRAIEPGVFHGLLALERSATGAVKTGLGMTETMGPHSGQAHADYRVVDPADGTILPLDQEGEICVRGHFVAASLLKREREETFDRDGYYHTGDRGFVADGWVWFTGRMSEMIKSNGANVAPPEVEAVLVSFPEVKSAYVFGLPDEARGEIVVAVIVAHDGATIDSDAIVERSKKELSAFKLPRTIVVLDESEVPLTSTSKADKRRLRLATAERLGVAL